MLDSCSSKSELFHLHLKNAFSTPKVHSWLGQIQVKLKVGWIFWLLGLQYQSHFRDQRLKSKEASLVVKKLEDGLVPAPRPGSSSFLVLYLCFTSASFGEFRFSERLLAAVQASFLKSKSAGFLGGNRRRCAVFFSAETVCWPIESQLSVFTANTFPSKISDS